MKTHAIALLALTVALSLPLTAKADDNAFFGADLGGTSYNLDSTDNYGTGGSAYRFFLGWQLSQSVGIEASYTDFGTQSDFFDSGAPDGGGFNQNVDAKGFGLALIGTRYISDSWSMYARIGALNTKLDINQTDSSGDVFSAADNGTHGMLGIGMAFDFGPDFSIRFGLDSYLGVGNTNTTGHGSITLGYIGAVAYF